ncbi:MAG: LLM class flavin-dependent oxidoreductase [Cytophagales bacterium]|nr:LLM class flavin-dependent oxidoreductase [Cytophagales bacterium]
MTSKLKLSILDQSVAVQGRSHADSIQATLALAVQAESWSYHRFWVSEHHSHPTIVGSAPEVLMAAIAARTTRIRIGSAGVMLPHYASLKVAEQFRVLDSLAPNRIDLGVGRAPGSDQRTSRLLNPDPRSSDHFPRQVQELMIWSSASQALSDKPAQSTYPTAYAVQAFPASTTAPTVWMLGSSDYGAQLAAELGLPYAFAYFITDGQGTQQALDVYRQNYQPSAAHPKPHALLCVWALAADTQAQAWRLFQSRARARMDRNLGRNAALLSPEDSIREWTPSEEQALKALRDGAFVGTGEQVVSKLQALADKHDLDEIAVITWTHDPAAQARSYELLAAASKIL